MIWSELDIEILVVSLPRSVERRSLVSKRFDALNVAYRFIDGIDGTQQAEFETAFKCDGNSVNSVYEHRDSLVSPAEIACTLSHLQAIYEAYITGNRYVLICEDDVDFVDVSPAEFLGVLDKIPADAGHLQFCITPAKTVKRLSDYFHETGTAFLQRSKHSPNKFLNPLFDAYPVHCTAAYLITPHGAKLIVEKCFRDNRIVLPCDPKTLGNNAGLLSDRLIYRLSQDEMIHGYVHAFPTFSYEATDSLLHPEHLGEHKRAKEIAAFERHRLKKRLSA